MPDPEDADQPWHSPDAAAGHASTSLLTVDHRGLASRADLRFDSTFDLSDEGLPIGNGTMGSLVWTSPYGLKLQINRVDVYANGCETNSFFRRHHDHAYGWYCIEQYARMNTPGKGDGILRGWVDGQLAFEKTDVRMRDIARIKIECIWLNVCHGGSWVPATDDHLYIDNVVIARSYVGPMAKAPRAPKRDSSPR